MATPLAPERAPVRHNQTTDFDGLREEAADAFAKSGRKQGDVADELGVSQAAVSQALNRSGARYAALQVRIIEALTDYSVEDETRVVFRFVRKA